MKSHKARNFVVGIFATAMFASSFSAGQLSVSRLPLQTKFCSKLNPELTSCLLHIN